MSTLPALPDASDPQALLTALAERAVTALGPTGGTAAVELERERSLGDRLAGRPGRATLVRLTAPEQSLTLKFDGRRLSGESQRMSGGIVISRKTLPVGEWLQEFAARLAAIAADAAGDAAAAGRALSSLGVQAAGSDVTVSEHDLDSGLAGLPLRTRGRLPDDAQAAVERIAGLLRDAASRVSDGEDAVVVRLAATRYLPDTLRAYLSLPGDWARTHRLSDGRTPADALAAQLADLEHAASGMRDAAVARDATALQVNGRFLTDRFAESSLDLP